MLKLIIILLIVSAFLIFIRFTAYNAYRYDGKMKWLFHGFFRFHRPDDVSINDGDSRCKYARCKYCGKIIREYRDDFWD